MNTINEKFIYQEYHLVGFFTPTMPKGLFNNTIFEAGSQPSKKAFSALSCFALLHVRSFACRDIIIFVL